MGNLSSKNSKVKGKTATQLLPQIIWTNIVGRLTVNDVFKSILLVSKELKAVGEAFLKNKDRLAITVHSDPVIQCFDSSHFITEKDFLTLHYYPCFTLENVHNLARMMPWLKILVVSYCTSLTKRYTNVITSSCTEAFPNLVCLSNPWLCCYPDRVFPKIEHLVIERGKHLDKIVPSLQSLNIWSGGHYEIDEIPDSCKRLIVGGSSIPNFHSPITHNRLPPSLEVLDVRFISFEGYNRQWRPFFRRLKDITIGDEIKSTESFINFIRDHKSTLERFKLTLNCFSEEELTQILLEVSDIKKVVINIRRPISTRHGIDNKFKVLSTFLTGEAKNLFLEIDLDDSCYLLIVSFLKNLPTSTASAVFTLSLQVTDYQKKFHL